MTSRLVFRLLALFAAGVLFAACSKPSRVGTTAPPIEADLWINVPSGAAPNLEGRVLLLSFFSPT